MANSVAELVFIPGPALGHIMSSVEIAKLFVNRDHRLSVTILVIKPPGSSSGSAITNYIESLAKNSMNRMSFVELPQVKIPPTGVAYSFINNYCNNVRNIVSNMISKPGSGHIVGFVIDMLCSCMIDVANEFDIPSFVFYTSSVAFLRFASYILTLYDNKNQDVVQLSNSDTEVSVPTFINPVPTKVFPTVFQSKETLDFVTSAGRKLTEAKAIIVNSFMELETHAIKSLSSENTIQPVYPVGPILNLVSGSGARKPSDDDIVRWLDDQPPSSVVFLCFGSMGSFDEVQVKEIAHALEHSGYRFMWSLRQPASDQISKVTGDYDDPNVVLPKGFLERTAGIGKVVGWAPQVEILAHHAVGGFVSHCGWNSLLESLWFGVPVATLPMYAEQQINAFEMVVELGLAVEIKLDYRKNLHDLSVETVIVHADEIESGIRRLMEDDLVRSKVKMMSEKSKSTVMEGGSSYACFGSLIQELMRNIS